MAVDWETCAEEGCNGVVVLGDACIAHGWDDDLLDAIARNLDLRGVPLTRRLLALLLERVPRDEGGRRVLGAARFEHAVFADDVDFREVVFTKSVSFANARFEGEADFSEADFASACFDVATFARAATFAGASFGPATFRDTDFRGAVEMTKVTFNAGADFYRVLFGDTAPCGRARSRAP